MHSGVSTSVTFLHWSSRRNVSAWVLVSIGLLPPLSLNTYVPPLLALLSSPRISLVPAAPLFIYLSIHLSLCSPHLFSLQEGQRVRGKVIVPRERQEVSGIPCLFRSLLLERTQASVWGWVPLFLSVVVLVSAPLPTGVNVMRTLWFHT